jgi:hypothetical protein
MDDVYCPSAWVPSLDGVRMRAVGTDDAGRDGGGTNLLEQVEAHLPPGESLCT